MERRDRSQEIFQRGHEGRVRSGVSRWSSNEFKTRLTVGILPAGDLDELLDVTDLLGLHSQT